MQVKDPRTGDFVSLFRTKEYVADIEAMEAEYACDHKERTPRFRVVSGGARQLCEQCLRCGARVGSAIKQSAAQAGAADFDEKLEPEFLAAKRSARDAVCIKHIDLERARAASFQKEYDAYIASPAWAAKRSKVMKRARGLCEGCLEAPAEQVHHLSYAHFKDELLFELVAVCRACHDKVHGTDADAYEPPCSGCQHRADDLLTCDLFAMPIDQAMAETGPCTPHQLHLMPYK